MSTKGTGLAAFTERELTRRGSATAVEMVLPGSEQQRQRGKKDVVALTVRLQRAGWARLNQLAVAEGLSLQSLVVRGLNRGLPNRVCRSWPKRSSPVTVKKAERSRDYAKERHLATDRRAGRIIVTVRQGLAEGDRELWQVLQAIILCGLPYQPTETRHFTRTARLADGSTVSVTFSTSLEAPMPFGSDRTLLHFLMDRAVKTGSRFVSWETATEFLTTMHLAMGGKNHRNLRSRFERIRGLTIGVKRQSAGASNTRLMPVIRQSLTRVTQAD